MVCHINFIIYFRLTSHLSETHSRDCKGGKLSNYINQYHSEPLQRVYKVLFGSFSGKWATSAEKPAIQTQA